ncbi:unnamed protein product [Ilex paraguariensis]|uniref:Polygalacturonase n=1 Tax=Ilex paraguariensis TaxID=185542 RepID=A0ABC8TK02_9AQUA
MKMVLQSLVVPLFIILMSCPSCFCNFQKVPLSDNLDETPGHKPMSTVYSTSIATTIINRHGNFSSNFPTMVEREKDIYRKLVQVGTKATSPWTFNVDDFGARGDKTDDSEAFNKAWKEACSFEGVAVLVIPANRTYHLKPITFSGPCKSVLTMMVHGTIKASPRRSDYKESPRQWIVFEKMNNFIVEGGGTINGNGRPWWRNSCKINKSLPCVGAPTAVTFDNCINLRVANIRIKNAQQMHLTFQDCVNVIASNLKVIAPEKSPNTDGIHVHGTIKASPRRSDYKESPRQWIVFEKMNNFIVEGGGTINGNGRPWWRNSCKINKSLAVTFDNCINLRVANIRIKNAQQMHLTFQDCVNVIASNLKVIAPEKSPNTDGIHVTGTQNIQIMSSLIRTGDDCISIVSGSKNVRATDIICGPGHGIRISGTTNGVRIKTWQGGSGYAKNIKFQNIIMHNVTNPIIINQNYCDQPKSCPEQGGSGYAKNIKFQNIIMHNVTNPIIINQNYCDQPKSCPEQHSAVQVTNVVYKNIRGTSASEVAVKLDCSKTFPCSDIVLQNVNLVREGETKAKASCQNVSLASTGRVSPLCH